MQKKKKGIPRRVGGDKHKFFQIGRDFQASNVTHQFTDTEWDQLDKFETLG
jgi:hypothetical protein